jgi:hypothetical protein
VRAGLFGETLGAVMGLHCRPVERLGWVRGERRGWERVGGRGRWFPVAGYALRSSQSHRMFAISGRRVISGDLIEFRSASIT